MITIHLLIIALISFVWTILWSIFIISSLVIIIANIIVNLVIDRLHYHSCIFLVSFLSWFFSSGPLARLINSTSIYSFNLNVTNVSLLFRLFKKTSWSDNSTRLLWRIEEIISHIIIKVRGRSNVRWLYTSRLILMKLVKWYRLPLRFKLAIVFLFLHANWLITRYSRWIFVIFYRSHRYFWVLALHTWHTNLTWMLKGSLICVWVSSISTCISFSFLNIFIIIAGKNVVIVSQLLKLSIIS